MKNYLFIFLTSVFSICYASTDDVLKKALRASEAGDYATAYTLLLPLAERGGAEFQFSLALILANDVSIGTKISKPERYIVTLKWLRRAADSGHIKAAEMLADTFKYGWFEQYVNFPLSECWKLVKTKRQKSNVCYLLSNSIDRRSSKP